jgi:transposase InsO family protein
LYPQNITTVCAIAGVARSGYYAWKRSSGERIKREEKDELFRDQILAHTHIHIGITGYRGVTLKFPGVNHKAVARIMGKYELQARIRAANPYKNIYKKTEEHSVVTNIVDRHFAVLVPETVGGTDISYLRWRGRFVYFSLVKDFASSEALAWKVSRTLEHRLVLDTIEILKGRLGENIKDFMLHSDQGWHYTHPVYRNKLTELGMVQSMSRKGNCIDNAKTETFFGHMKDELDISDCETFEELVRKVDAFMYYYNNMRQMWSKRKMTPVQYRSHLVSPSIC